MLLRAQFLKLGLGVCCMRRDDDWLRLAHEHWLSACGMSQVVASVHHIWLRCCVCLLRLSQWRSVWNCNVDDPRNESCAGASDEETHEQVAEVWDRVFARVVPEPSQDRPRDDREAHCKNCRRSVRPALRWQCAAEWGQKNRNTSGDDTQDAKRLGGSDLGNVACVERIEWAEASCCRRNPQSKRRDHQEVEQRVLVDDACWEL